MTTPTIPRPGTLGAPGGLALTAQVTLSPAEGRALFNGTATPYLTPAPLRWTTTRSGTTELVVFPLRLDPGSLVTKVHLHGQGELTARLLDNGTPVDLPHRARELRHLTVEVGLDDGAELTGCTVAYRRRQAAGAA